MAIPWGAVMSTVIVKPTWSVDGWVGNEIDDNGVTWFVHKETGWSTPLGVRTRQAARSEAHGNFRTRNYKNARVVSLSGIARAATPDACDAAIDQFNALGSDGNLHEFVATEPRITRTAMVEVSDGSQLDRLDPLNFEFQLILIAPDPVKYHQDEQSASTGLPVMGSGLDWTTGGGLDWTTGGGLNWGTTSSNGTLTIVNSGTAEIWPRFSVSATSARPSITYLGRTLQYEGTVSTGQSLDIDTYYGSRSVLHSGVSRRNLLSTAEWTAIPPKSSVSVQFATDIYNATATLTAWWHAGDY